jgi:hypothetical protein
MKRITGETGKFQRFEMLEEEYKDLTDAMEGLCVACGSVRDCCEPDAERYDCEDCEKRTVYGTEQLLLMGRIEFSEGGAP